MKNLVFKFILICAGAFFCIGFSSLYGIETLGFYSVCNAQTIEKSSEQGIGSIYKYDESYSNEVFLGSKTFENEKDMYKEMDLLKRESNPNFIVKQKTVNLNPQDNVIINVNLSLYGVIIEPSPTNNVEVSLIGMESEKDVELDIQKDYSLIDINISGKINKMYYISTEKSKLINVVRIKIPKNTSSLIINGDTSIVSVDSNEIFSSIKQNLTNGITFVDGKVNSSLKFVAENSNIQLTGKDINGNVEILSSDGVLKMFSNNINKKVSLDAYGSELFFTTEKLNADMDIKARNTNISYFFNEYPSNLDFKLDGNTSFEIPSNWDINYKIGNGKPRLFITNNEGYVKVGTDFQNPEEPTTESTTKVEEPTTESTTQEDNGKEEACILRVGNIKATEGTIIDVPISIENNKTGFSSFGMKLRFDPEFLTPVSVSSGAVWTDEILFNINNGDDKYYKDGQVIMAGLSSQNRNDNGIIAYVKFKVNDKLGQNEYTYMSLEVDEFKYVDKNYNVSDVLNFVINGDIEIIKFLKGDMNGDGLLTPADANEILLYYTGLKPVNDSVVKTADVNEDGLITPSDATHVLMQYVSNAGKN